MFSMLVAYEKRRWPSPNSPKAVPREAGHAGLVEQAVGQRLRLEKPVPVMFGKT